jgi:hypothetical protein
VGATIRLYGKTKDGREEVFQAPRPIPNDADKKARIEMALQERLGKYLDAPWGPGTRQEITRTLADFWNDLEALDPPQRKPSPSLANAVTAGTFRRVALRHIFGGIFA